MLYLIEILHQTTTDCTIYRTHIQLYLIEILHQTTTDRRGRSGGAELYLIEILHQTTTMMEAAASSMGCILLKFYIKPQPLRYPVQ